MAVENLLSKSKRVSENFSNSRDPFRQFSVKLRYHFIIMIHLQDDIKFIMSGPDLAVSLYNPLICSQCFERHRAACMKLLR